MCTPQGAPLNLATFQGVGVMLSTVDLQLDWTFERASATRFASEMPLVTGKRFESPMLSY